MKIYAEEERLLSQPRTMLISSFTLQNGTLIISLLLFYLQLDLVCTKIHRFVEYNPKKCFNRFVQAAVDARRKGDENPNSSVVAETVNLLANSSYGYQSMDQSRHTVTKCLTDKKTHAANYSKMFKKLDHVNNSLYEVELAKAQIEHKEPIIVGFFILQYAKLLLLERHCKIFTSYVTKFEKLEMDTDLLYLLLPRKNWKVVWQLKWKGNGRGCDQMTVSIASLLMLYQFSSQEHVVQNTNNMIRESMAYVKKSSDVQRCYVFVVRHTAAMKSPLLTLNLAVKGSINAYRNRVVTEHWKSIGESWLKR